MDKEKEKDNSPLFAPRNLKGKITSNKDDETLRLNAKIGDL
jgi:hypothetical protein